MCKVWVVEWITAWNGKQESRVQILVAFLTFTYLQVLLGEHEPQRDMIAQSVHVHPYQHILELCGRVMANSIPMNLENCLCFNGYHVFCLFKRIFLGIIWLDSVSRFNFGTTSQLFLYFLLSFFSKKFLLLFSSWRLFIKIPVIAVYK